MTTPQQTPKKKGMKWLPFAIGGAAVLIAVALIVILLMGGGAKKLDLLEYVEVKETVGFNGMGEVVLAFDYAALAKDLEMEEVKDVRSLAEIQEEKGYSVAYVMENVKELSSEHDLELDELRDLFKTISIEIPDNGTYSNGDKVVIEVDVKEDKEYSDRVEGGEMEYEVKGLKDLVNVELNITCTFSGMDGEGMPMLLIADEPQEWHQFLAFSCEEEGRLSNGDKAKIVATVYEGEYERLKEEFRLQGLILPATFEWEFTVSGLSVRLTPEACTDDLIDQAEKIVKEHVRLADETLVARVSMVYFVKDGSRDHIVVALEFPDAAANRTWNHIRYLSNVSVNEEGKLEYGAIEHVLGGNGFNEQQQERYIKNFDDFNGCTLTKLR